MGGGEQGPSTGLIPGGGSRQGQASWKAQAQRQGWAQVREPIKTASLGLAGGTREKKTACQCRRHKRRKFDPCLGRSPGGGHGNPLQCSCLENPTDRGAWRAAVSGVAKSRTRLRDSQGHNTQENQDSRPRLDKVTGLCKDVLHSSRATFLSEDQGTPVPRGRRTSGARGKAAKQHRHKRALGSHLEGRGDHRARWVQLSAHALLRLSLHPCNLFASEQASAALTSKHLSIRHLRGLLGLSAPEEDTALLKGKKVQQRGHRMDFSGPGVDSPPAIAEATGSVPGPGRRHILQSD